MSEGSRADICTATHPSRRRGTHAREKATSITSRWMGLQMPALLPMLNGRTVARSNLGFNPSYDFFHHEARGSTKLDRPREQLIRFDTTIERGSAVMTAKLHSSRHAYKRLVVHKCILVHSRDCGVLKGMETGRSESYPISCLNSSRPNGFASQVSV